MLTGNLYHSVSCTNMKLYKDCWMIARKKNKMKIKQVDKWKVYKRCMDPVKWRKKPFIMLNQLQQFFDHRNILYIPYRPIGRANTMRSSVDLIEIRCYDNECMMIQKLCWVCPIHSTINIISFEYIYSIKSNFIKEFVLMLPTLNEDNRQDFMNNYYCVGHTWTE